MAVQTRTSHHLQSLPRKQELVDEFVGKSLASVRTPAMVIDRAIFARNCARMHQNAKDWGAGFRAHLKTHKTTEGTRLQLISSADKTQAVVVSTLMEAWGVVNAGLVADGTIKDILYGLPVGINKVADLAALWDEMEKYEGIVRLLIDHPGQVKYLEEFEKYRENSRKWSVFVKVDGGQRRAGVSTVSPSFEQLLATVFASPAISVYGFYGHAGNAYGSTNPSEAVSFLVSEIEAVNTAAGLALAFLSKSPHLGIRSQPFVLSVGSTPTAHAATSESKVLLSSLLNGTLELHAGNYPMLDLQQQHTGLIGRDRISQRVLATVISYYAGRGEGGTDEALCDAGAIAMSKDTGPGGGFGEVIGKPWRLGRISQEHGILTRIGSGKTERDQGEELELGSIVEIVGQHACLTAAGFPWYYVIDSDIENNGKQVVDVWIPWKGW